jgi:DNA-binding LacI/PurR family transcriptional regulator
MKENIPTKKKISLDDIARELGLSKSTVSRALSGKGRIGAETSARVHQYVKDMDYAPNLIARSLAQSKTYNLGVILPADSDLAEKPFFQVFLLGACEAAAANDYDIVVTVVVEKDISALKRLVHNRKVDGIILTRLLVHDLAATYLKKTGVPFLVVGSSTDEALVQIDTDHETACEKLTSLLISMGNRKTALIIGSDEHAVNVSRFRGYIKAAEASGEGSDRRIIFQNIGTKTAMDKSVEAAIREGADCILCGDDIICSQVLSKLNNMGLSIPDGIRVASFYDSAHLKYNNPPITALEIDVKELGVVAGQSLIDMISGKEIKRRTILNYQIALKKSTQ